LEWLDVTGIHIWRLWHWRERNGDLFSNYDKAKPLEKEEDNK